MNDNETSNPNAGPPQDQGQPQSESGSGPTSSAHAGGCVFEPLRSACHEGAHRAQAAAEKTIPVVKAALNTASYWLGFGVSFASVFSYTIVKELTPEALKVGCREGARAGRKAAENSTSKRQPEVPLTPAPVV
jgi:hypothetical protein